MRIQLFKFFVAPLLSACIFSYGNAQIEEHKEYKIKSLAGLSMEAPLSDISANDAGKRIILKTDAEMAQQFFYFIKTGDNLYNIKTSHGFYVTAKYEALTGIAPANGGKGAAGSGFVITQEKLYAEPTKPVAASTTPRPALQQWKILFEADNATCVIYSVAFPQQAIAPVNSLADSGLKLVKPTVDRNAKWKIARQSQID